jgi:hypothetical protein
VEDGERHTGFVGFKTKPAEGKRYREAAEAREVALSVLVRTAVDALLSGGSHAIARTKAEALLLKAVRMDAALAADLTAIGAATSDRDVREIVRRLAVVLSAETGGSKGGGGRRR